MASGQERSWAVGSGASPDGGGHGGTGPDGVSGVFGTGSRDPLEVVGGRLGSTALETTLNGLLRAHPTAVVLALDDRATRVPLPDDDQFATCHELPAVGKTVMDFVEPADRMVVVSCWERARAVGLGQDRVRLTRLTEPVHSLTIIDARGRHGVWIELLVPQIDRVAAAHTPPRVELPPPSRPRTAVIHKNLSAVIVAIDERMTGLVGWSADDMVGRRSLDFLHPDDHERAVGQWLEMRSQRANQRVRVRHRLSDGSWLWVEIENEYLGAEDPDGVVAVARVTDVSEEMAAVESLRQQEALFRRLAESLPVGVVQLGPDRHIVYANARARALLGAAPAASWPELVDTVGSVGRARLEQAVTAALAGGPDDGLEAAVGRPEDPARRQCLFTVVGTAGPEGQATGGVLVSVTDVTDSVRLREQLRHQATRDPLTGCLNRSAVLAALDEALHGSDAAALAVVFLDLDGFKTVNDTAGHAVGDELLGRIGNRLIEFAGQDGHVGRLGGDEFLVLRPHIADEETALAIAEQLRDRISAPLQLPAGRFRVHTSVGVALARPGASPDALVVRADRAMYSAKKAGGNRVGMCPDHRMHRR